MKGINIKGAINTKRKSFLVAPFIHPRRHQRLLCRQTKPGTAGWSIHNKGSEVRAVKRLLTSHFICQTFISLFMVQRTPSAQARVHTCAWSTFKAFLPTFHDLADKRKMPDFCADAQTDELLANNKHSVGNSGFSCSFESWIIKISDGINGLCSERNVQVWWWRCQWWAWLVFAHSYICMLIYVYVWVSPRRTRQPVTHGPAAAAACAVSISADWQREGRPSLWLTQAERGFLHIFCGAIWALVSVAAPLWTHLAAQSVDGHLLFQPPGEERKQPPKPSIYLSIYLSVYL